MFSAQETLFVAYNVVKYYSVFEVNVYIIILCLLFNKTNRII